MADTKLAKKEPQKEELANVQEVPLGFEDETSDDFIIPRIKVCSALTPEVREKLAEEGDIINSLTHEKYNGQTFIPVLKFNSNILWRERADGGGIKCRAQDGKTGFDEAGARLVCAQCRKNEFDNSKTGREAIPQCTKYLNFLGWIQGEPMPIILSFAKTNYNIGKKLYSMAKVTRQNMWNFGYILKPKEMSKAGNDWFIIDIENGGPTSEEERVLGMQLYQQFFGTIANINYDANERDTTIDVTPETSEENEF